jgi:MerR family transcriptional regulator, light-induced transcriptional regulator
MDSFSISDLAQYSGIKSHTIRIWEKRYNALKPHRSSGNTRYYDSRQLRRLLNISALLDADYRVSELCTMSDEGLRLLSQQVLISKTPAPTEYFISQLIAAALSYDELQFVNIFSHCLLRYGLRDTYTQVLYPTLHRIGLMWLTDSLPTANEHFISNLIRQKLFTASDTLPLAKPGSPLWILFLPENEFHEIGLLLASYLIRLSGQRVIYLGGNVPESAIRAAVKDLKPENILLSFVHHDLIINIQKYIDRLRKDMPVNKIWIAANPELSYQLKAGKRIRFLGSAEELALSLEQETV